MRLRVELDFGARRDVNEASAWYSARNPRLAGRFVQELRQKLQRIAEHPRAYTPMARGTRRATLRKFPYSIVFRVQPEHVDVIAIVHGARNPDSWSDRVSEPLVVYDPLTAAA